MVFSFTRKFKLLLCLVFVSISISSQDKNEGTAFFEKGQELKFMNPDSAIVNYNKALNYWEVKKDTVNMISALTSISSVHGHNVNFSKAYDGYWKALLLADNIDNKLWRGRIYQELGYLYSFFKRDKEALEYFNMSLKVSKELNKEGVVRVAYVLSDYFAITNFYRVNEDFDLAKKYLDSCYVIQDKISFSSENLYVETERGYLLAQENKYDKSLKILKEAKLFFQEKNKSYLVIVNHLLGKVYRKMEDFQKAEKAYLESIEYSNTYKSHNNYMLMNYDALTEMYKETKQYKKAFIYLNKSKVLNDKIFGSKSIANRDLLKIKDSFRVVKENQEKMQRKHELEQLKQEESISKLKQILLIVSIVFIVLFSILFVRNLRLKHKTEKRLIEERQANVLQRQMEVLELKNKELTAKALQLIEKEEFLTSLNEKLSKQKNESVDVSTIKRMVKSIQGNPNGNWKEFETRFTSVNQSFYKNLKERFPNLSTTDQKVCALIKLKLSSKEMSSLLGISVESVHTSRYRLRKKMNLDRNENLTDFMNSI